MLYKEILENFSGAVVQILACIYIFHFNLTSKQKLKFGYGDCLDSSVNDPSLELVCYTDDYQTPN